MRSELSRLAEIATTWSAIPFDGHLVLGHPAMGGLMLLHPSARPLWEHLRYESDPTSLLEHPVDQTNIRAFVDGCRMAGLFDVVPTPSPQTPPAERLIDALDGGLDATYRCGDRPVRLRCANGQLSTLLGAVLEPCRSEAPPQVDICVASDGNDFHVFEDHRWFATFPSFIAARNAVLHRLIHLGRPDRRFTAVLHGAAILRGAECILLLGRSGAGKSTLAAALVADGCQLISDDLIPLEAAANRVWTVPFALSVKEGSWPLLANPFPRLRTTPTFHAGSRRVRYVADVPRPAAPAGLPVGALIFVRYDPDAVQTLTPLRPVEALTALIETANTFPVAPQDRTALLAWLATRPAWRLTFRSLYWAGDRVRDRATAGPAQTSEPPGGPESACPSRGLSSTVSTGPASAE